jgi:hypothetical protein
VDLLPAIGITRQRRPVQRAPLRSLWRRLIVRFLAILLDNLPLGHLTMRLKSREAMLEYRLAMADNQLRPQLVTSVVWPWPDLLWLSQFGRVFHKRTHDCRRRRRNQVSAG